MELITFTLISVQLHPLRPHFYHIVMLAGRTDLSSDKSTFNMFKGCTLPHCRFVELAGTQSPLSHDSLQLLTVFHVLPGSGRWIATSWCVSNCAILFEYSDDQHNNA